MAKWKPWKEFWDEYEQEKNPKPKKPTVYRLETSHSRPRAMRRGGLLVHKENT